MKDRLVSPSGRVHYASAWTKARWPITLCGWPVTWGWGATQQRPVRAVTCGMCVKIDRGEMLPAVYDQEVEHG